MVIHYYLVVNRVRYFAFDRLRETIIATLETLAAGKITAKELPIPDGAGKQHIRYAPGFSFIAPAQQASFPSYTIDALAKFLGEVDKAGHATHDFRDTFGALELIDGNGLKEGDIAAQYARGRRFLSYFKIN